MLLSAKVRVEQTKPKRHHEPKPTLKDHLKNLFGVYSNSHKKEKTTVVRITPMFI